VVASLVLLVCTVGCGTDLGSAGAGPGEAGNRRSLSANAPASWGLLDPPELGPTPWAGLGAAVEEARVLGAEGGGVAEGVQPLQGEGRASAAVHEPLRGVRRRLRRWRRSGHELGKKPASVSRARTRWRSQMAGIEGATLPEWRGAFSTPIS